MADRDEPYVINVPDDFYEAMERLQPGHVNRLMSFIRDHLQQTPTVRIPGTLKKLHGEWADYFQFEVSHGQGIKLIYTVDEEQRTVQIEYPGQHPNWRRSRDSGSL